ncbi:hypothetical protein HX805_11485 [Pseudomonas sp. G5001]|jgi:hypothetical protein|uniref:hypothetical protein n=1 Tax=unclassified Pseudomonas TaxID=196821 RepID=UPI0015A05D79|nr:MULTISPECIES: hypothetical protein [unclassified Pseudomonas]NWB73093.1 hypothetical protein [Pseudomonas sp. G5001]NWD01548.1 hypothetical protein [Pseudomonas sp. P7779]
MTDPKANGSSGDMHVVLVPEQNMMLTHDVLLTALSRLVAVAGYHGGVNGVSIHFLRTGLSGIQKGDVFKVGVHDGLEVAAIDYTFEGDHSIHEAVDGKITVEDIDHSLPSLRLSFEFHGEFNHEVENFHGSCRVEGLDNSGYEKIKSRFSKDRREA